MFKSVIFRWEPATYQNETNAQICDVPGVGRLLAKRVTKGSRNFVGLINGKHATMEVKGIDAAKRELEKFVQGMVTADELFGK
jgi:hypothetical protein